jgi:hypothetical protein
MASATPVTDHDEIREWVESRGGRPACVKGTAALLRVDFGEPDEKLQPIEWDQWFETFDSSNLAALIQPGGRSRFLKLVSRSASKGARGGGTRAGGTARKNAGGRAQRSIASKRGGAKSAAKKGGRSAGAGRKSVGSVKSAVARKSARKTTARAGARKTGARAGVKRGGASTGGSTRKGGGRKASSGRGGRGR